jgi:hypothetical protein
MPMCGWSPGRTGNRGEDVKKLRSLCKASDANVHQSGFNSGLDRRNPIVTDSDFSGSTRQKADVGLFHSSVRLR